ncbi:MAG TPA: hypothetical protein VMU67_09060 [Steroidobacteraceae bacterium]|nr:hypothetical protein [Steroidobacteraceae bacterium]
MADYVPMVGLTRINPDVKVGDPPSILNSFTASARSRPAALSDRDRTFLQALYHTDVALRDQRFEVSDRMARVLGGDAHLH